LAQHFQPSFVFLLPVGVDVLPDVLIQHQQQPPRSSAPFEHRSVSLSRSLDVKRRDEPKGGEVEAR
jgi:hypothetical protein